METFSSLRTIDDFLVHSTIPRDSSRNMLSRSSTMSDRRISVGASIADLIKVGATRKARTSSSPTMPFDFDHHADSILLRSYASDEEVASPVEIDDLSSLASVSGMDDGDAEDLDDSSEHDVVHRVSDELARSCRLVDDECSSAKAVRIVRAGNPKVVVVARSSLHSRSDSDSTAPSDGRDSHQFERGSAALTQFASQSGSRPSTDDAAEPLRRPSLRVQTRADSLAWSGTITKCEAEPRASSPSAPSLLRRKKLPMPLSLRSLGRSVRNRGSKAADADAKSTATAPNATSTASKRTSVVSAPATATPQSRPTPAKLIPRGAAERAPIMVLPPSPTDLSPDSDEDSNDLAARPDSSRDEMHPGFWMKRKATSSSVALDSRSGQPMVYKPDRGRAPPAGLSEAPSVVYAHA